MRYDIFPSLCWLSAFIFWSRNKWDCPLQQMWGLRTRTHYFQADRHTQSKCKTRTYHTISFFLKMFRLVFGLMLFVREMDLFNIRLKLGCGAKSIFSFHWLDLRGSEDFMQPKIWQRERHKSYNFIQKKGLLT